MDKLIGSKNLTLEYSRHILFYWQSKKCRRYVTDNRQGKRDQVAILVSNRVRGSITGNYPIG